MWILIHIQAASATSAAVVRTVDHFDQLKALLELERAADRARIAEAMETLPLGELERRGLVALDLESVEESVGLGGRFLVTLEHADKRPIRTSLTHGDLVAIRPRKAEIDEPSLALVTRSTRFKLQVAFDRSPPPYVHEGRLRLDVVTNDITYDRARSAIDRV